jgi:hypothetical protein
MLEPAETVDVSQRYLSKPPPGTGRYRSMAPAALENPTYPRSTERSLPPPAEPRTSTSGGNTNGEDTQPLRQPRSSRPRAQTSLPPPRPRTSLAPPAAHSSVNPAPNTLASAIGRASLHASKPAPGTGAYHSQGVTTELISVPPTAPVPDMGQTQAAMAATAPTDPAGPRTSDAPRPPIRASEVPAKRRSAIPPASPAQTGPDPRQRAEQLLLELCQRKQDEELHQVQALHALGEPSLSLLLERFPGPLWFDRRKTHARVPFGRDIGPVCRALEAFAESALVRFGPLLRSSQVETRYYATLFACDRVHGALLEPLLERLFDEDAQIRLLVRDVLPHYRRLPGFERVAQQLCAQALANEAPLRTRLAAIDAIEVLREASSVPTLIELISHGDKQITIPAHRALMSITCQDFGKAAKKWRAWYEVNAYRHRVEWLIEGLMHADQALRASAGLELQKLTQVYYGYVAAASKRERELAQKRYWDWWRAEGRKKF